MPAQNSTGGANRLPAAGGWRAFERLSAAEEEEPPAALRAEAAGDYETARTVAVEAAEIGERFGDADLLALALQEQGRAQLRLGRIGPGLKLLDEAMVGVAAGETSPLVTGLVYCSVIDGCQEAHELSRARDRRPGPRRGSGRAGPDCALSQGHSKISTPRRAAYVGSMTSPLKRMSPERLSSWSASRIAMWSAPAERFSIRKASSS
jgi:hypothetical protein